MPLIAHVILMNGSFSRICLSFTNTLTVSVLTIEDITAKFYVINGEWGIYNANTGVYYINNVPAEWTIAFLNNGKEKM